LESPGHGILDQHLDARPHERSLPCGRWPGSGPAG
jgi:hypothetical protein